MLTLILFLAGCSSPANTNSNMDGNPSVQETGSGDTGSNVDSDVDTDTGEDIVGGNCGGPEPPEDSIWVCENGTSDLEGEAWPAAGGPEDLEQCLTSDGWEYELSEDGSFATLTRGDGWVLTCELDN